MSSPEGSRFSKWKAAWTARRTAVPDSPEDLLWDQAAKDARQKLEALDGLNNPMADGHIAYHWHPIASGNRRVVVARVLSAQGVQLDTPVDHVIVNDETHNTVDGLTEMRYSEFAWDRDRVIAADSGIMVRPIDGDWGDNSLWDCAYIDTSGDRLRINRGIANQLVTIDELPRIYVSDAEDALRRGYMQDLGQLMLGLGQASYEQHMMGELQ